MFFPLACTEPSALLARNSRPGKVVQMSEAELKYLCIKSKQIFLEQPTLLELEAPIKICGTHSALTTL